MYVYMYTYNQVRRPLLEILFPHNEHQYFVMFHLIPPFFVLRFPLPPPRPIFHFPCCPSQTLRHIFQPLPKLIYTYTT